MLNLPNDVTPYKRTSTFSKNNVPKGLLSRHNTKKDTWGLIVVENGSVEYTIFNKSSADSSMILSPGNPGVIEPQVYHKVKLMSDETIFYVEFYAKDNRNVSVPDFIKNKDIKNVEEDEDTVDVIRRYLVQLTCIGVFAIIVGMLMIQFSEWSNSSSFDVLVET